MSRSMTLEPVFTLVASDIDGTLVDDQSNLSDRTRRVLRAAHAHGVEIVLVTGLNPWVARRYAAEIGPWVRIVCLNGIFTIEAGEVTPGRFLHPDVAREAVRVIVEHGCVPMVYGEDQVTRYLPDHSEGMAEVEDLIANRPYQPYVAVEREADLFASTPAQVGVCDTPERTAALYPVVHRALGDGAYVVHQPGGRTWVEVSHPEARKDTALQAVMRRLDVAPAEVVYFGDSLNDLPVFRWLPYAVAMANALPEVKALAWLETRSNVEDGVAHFLARYYEVPFE